MDLSEIAQRSGVPLDKVVASLSRADEFVKLSRGVATRTGSVVHLAAFPQGLGGRGVLKECRTIIARWQARHGTLFTPVTHDNGRALRVAQALGFKQYGQTETHIWLARERDDHE